MVSLINRSISLKVCLTPKHCTVVYNTTRQDFTTLENYNGDICEFVSVYYYYYLLSVISAQITVSWYELETQNLTCKSHRNMNPIDQIVAL